MFLSSKFYQEQKGNISLLLIIALVGLIALFAATYLFNFKKETHALTSFVQKSGSDLFVDGQRFKFSGTNLYWLMWDDDGSRTSYFEIDDGILTAKEMGATAIRTWGPSLGCPDCFEPELNVFNNSGLDRLDYAIKVAKDNDIRMVILLIDMWNYYPHVWGKVNFTSWRNLTNEDDFFTNLEVRSDFKNYVTNLLNHVNPYTGLAYKDDPTILAWETGNELWNTTTADHKITDWTADIAAHLKSTDPNHLVIDGLADGGGIDPASLTNPNIDGVDQHFYSVDINKLQNSAATLTLNNKFYYVGEFSSNLTNIDTLLSAIETNDVDMDEFWFLRQHHDVKGYPTGGSYPLYYPGGDDAMRVKAQNLRSHAYRMSNRIVSSHKVTDGPFLYPITQAQTGVEVTWRGVVAANTYEIERSTDNGVNWQVVKTGLTDFNSPWNDTTGNLTDLYRVRGVNLDGVKGCYSGETVCIPATPEPTPLPTPTPIPDITAPDVNITFPVNNSIVSVNQTINIAATASDTSGISKVEFYVNNTLKCPDTAAPYTCSWKVPGKKGVQYKVQAKAFDNSNNLSTSTIIVTSK